MRRSELGKKGKRAAEIPGESLRTLFVCVRDRNGKGASCAGSGARALLNQMQGILDAEAIGKDELLLRPAGCLGLCKRGPVLLAATGKAAQARKPKKPGKKAAGVYTKVRPDETREVLREVLCGVSPARSVSA